MYFVCRVFVAVAVVAVLHSPVVLCPVCSSLPFLVLVPAVRLLESWIVLVRLSVVRVVVLVLAPGLSERVRVLVFVFVDCSVVTVVSISVVYPYRVLMRCRMLLPVVLPVYFLTFWIVLVVFVSLCPGVGRLVVVLTFRVKER